MRHVIIHYHVYKNAGSSLDSILARNFPGAVVALDGDRKWETLDADFVGDYASARPEVRAISSHHARLPVPSVADVRFHPVVFLRHPLDRAGSVCYFELQEQLEMGNLNGPGITPADVQAFFVRRLGPLGGAVIKDFQTIHLAAREQDMRVARCTRSDLQTAFGRLDRLPFFGLVEKFDQSLSLLAEYLLRHGIRLDTAFTVQNARADREPTLERRLDRLRNELGETLWQDLVRQNEFDLLLYDHAAELFQSRLRTFGRTGS